MRIALLSAAALALSVAGSASAATTLSDAEYIQLSRCVGLAEALKADPAPAQAALDADRRGRELSVEGKARAARKDARREGGRSSAKDRVKAELDGACAALIAR